MDLKINNKQRVGYKGNEDYFGFIKIWESDPVTGKCELKVNKKNTILYQGADLLAYALAGQTNAKITHFYVGYSNATSFEGPDGSVDKSNPSFRLDNNYGYLKIPLTFAASYLHDTSYAHNIPVFTVLLSNPASYEVSNSPNFGTGSSLFEVGLVAEMTTGSTAGDKVFSRAQFTPLLYDNTHNLTISWGIKFTA